MKRMKTELWWAVHNLIAHPVSEILYWVGLAVPRARKLGDWIHDKTVPDHVRGTGRG